MVAPPAAAGKDRGMDDARPGVERPCAGNAGDRSNPDAADDDGGSSSNDGSRRWGRCEWTRGYDGTQSAFADFNRAW